MVPASHRTSLPESAPRRKDVLFCPSCGHESPVEEGWQLRTGSGRVVSRCPDCGTDATARPSREPEESFVIRSIGLAVSAFRMILAWATWPLRRWRVSTR